MNFEFIPYIFPLLAAAIVSILVAIYAWTRLATKGAPALLLLSLSIAEWTIGYSLEIAGTNLETKLVWGILQYFGIAFAPYAWLIFSLSYNDDEKKHPRYFLTLTALIPSITTLLALTTKWHGLIWSEYHITQQGNLSVLEVSHGIWFWVHFAYSYIILLIGAIILVRTLFRRQGMYRGQIIAMLIAVLAPWIGNILYLTGNSPIPNLDVTPFAFTITVIALAWAIFGFHLVDITPLARDRVIDSMSDGMIVLDVNRNIVDINSAAARMIGVTIANVIGQTAGEVFRPWPHLVDRFRNVMEANEEISVGEGNAKRHYKVRFSPLADQQNQLVGRIIMLSVLDEDATSKTATATKDQPPHPTPNLNPQTTPIPQGRLFTWLKDFFITPARTDLEIPKDINPGWYQARERSFTIIIRMSALVGTLAYLLTLPFVRTGILTSINIAYGSVIGLLWFLGMARKVKFTNRAIIFLFLVYTLGFVETINFGFSVESFIFFMTLVITSVLLTGRTSGWVSGGVSLLTLGSIGYLITAENFIPFQLTAATISPRSLETAITGLFVFTASATAISTSITILMESLNKAWQLETQALSLLQQERDLLEQRVAERTQELAEASDKAVKSSNELRKYFRAIDQSANSIVITDLDGNIEYVNPKFESVTGYSLEEVVGKNPRILKSGRQRIEFYEKLWGTITTGQVWTGVFHNKRKNGSLYWESATIAPVIDQNGVVTNYVAVKEDITARRMAEEQVRKLSQAVEQSGNTIIIMDKDGVIEYVNPRFTEVTGYSLADAIGKPTSVLMTGYESKRDYFGEEWWKTVSVGNVWRGEFHNRRKDGTPFWESAVIAPVQNQEGHITNFVEIKQDITEEKVLQERLQKQNDHLSILHQITLDLLNRRDINDLLQAVVDRSSFLLDAPISELMLVDGDALVVQAVTSNQQHSLKGERVTREQAKLSWQAFDSKLPVVLEDYSTWMERRNVYEEYAMHAVADFPILAGDRCLGVLAMGRSQPNYPYTVEQIETGVQFARLAALVLDNVSLYDSALHEIAERERAQESLQRASQQQQVINSLLRIGLADKPLEELLDSILEEILSSFWMSLDQKGGIFLANEQNNMLALKASKNLAPSLQKLCAQVAFGQCLCGRAAQSKQIQFSDCVDERHDIHYEGMQEHGHYNIPILQAERALGVIVLYLPHGYEKTEEDERFLQAVADTITGILERKRAEALLYESEMRFRQIVENASDIIYRTDVTGKFTYANPSALHMMGFTSEADVIGKNYLDLTTPEARHKLKRTYDHQFISRTKNTYFEFPAITTDGQIVWVGQNVQLIMDGETITGFQALARDITQLKQTQEAMLISRDQALDASHTKSQMLSRVSHELRTPLGGILGYAELLQQGMFGDLTDTQGKALTQIIDSTHFLTRMVNDLLDEAQIEAKSLSLNNHYFSPVELLNKVSTTVSVLADKKKGLIFQAEISPEIPNELFGDIHRLQQVLVNLAGNAIKFTKAGEVRICFKRPAPTQWSMEIIDTGVGIPQDDFETIFQPFRQVDNSITRENRGSGLGLAITKQLVELMDGQITVQSTIGKGSIFTVTLPITNIPRE